MNQRPETPLRPAAPAPVWPQPHPEAARTRILFVFAWLVVGGEETEVRLLARHLDPRRYAIEVIPCFRKEGMPEQTHRQLEEAGVRVDRTAYALSFEDTVAYLATRIPCFDIVVSCQNVADIYPALERLHLRPPLIEHGGLVSEALAGPKHFTSRYVGVCQTIRQAAAGRMERPENALRIPSMVDMDEVRPGRRGPVRRSLGYLPEDVVFGWVGRLDRKKRVEDFLQAAALVRHRLPEARFLVVGGPDAFMPDYAGELKALAESLGLGASVTFTGDRTDVADLLQAMDVFVWLSLGEGMPHVIAEAGAAGLAVVATPDNGALEQIADGRTGLIVPHAAPELAAGAMLRLAGDPALRRRLGRALRRKVEREYSAPVVVRAWERLFDEVRAEVPPAPAPSVFASFVQGGWECSTHRLRSGRRLDMVAATGHDRRTAADYRQLAGLGIRSMREGLRWHLMEPEPGRYDFSSAIPMIEAAVATRTQVVWDLLHYGWPDWLDIWSPEFVARFRAFAGAAGQLMRRLSPDRPFWCPVNEISFHAWAGGDAGYLGPFANGRGFELKVQLARAANAATEVLSAIDPRARFLACEPAIAIHCDPARPHEAAEARGWHEAQYQGYDLLSGRLWPQAGGRPGNLDLIGVNYYFNNQWIHRGPPIDLDHPLYRPLSDILAAVHARYGRPVVISETGIEGDRRGAWFDYVAGEVERARRRGVPVEGICLYPVADHPGWDDDRSCANGLLGMPPADAAAARPVCAPLAQAVRGLQARMEAVTGLSPRAAARGGGEG